jgi:hypothetical protein
VIVDEDTLKQAGETVVELDRRIKAIEDMCGPTKSSLHKAHKDFCAFETRLLSMYKPARKVLADKSSDWMTEQKRIQQEAQRKAEAAAAEASRKERERLEAQALAALDKGKEAKAEAFLDRADEVVAKPVFVPPTVQKTVAFSSGGSTTGKNALDIFLPTTPDDIKAACRAIADGLLPVSCVQFSLMQVKNWATGNRITGKRHGITIKEKVTASFKK